jgi:hypothetical protein
LFEKLAQFLNPNWVD